MVDEVRPPPSVAIVHEGHILLGPEKPTDRGDLLLWLQRGGVKLLMKKGGSFEPLTLIERQKPEVT